MIRLTKLALRRPVTIILCLITIAYFGFQSVMGMKLELTPEMEMPMLIIATVYPGATRGRNRSGYQERRRCDHVIGLGR